MRTRRAPLAGFGRREFLTCTVSYVTATLSGCNASGIQRSEPGGDAESSSLDDGTAFFPQSIASGDPRPNSVVLWTRAEDADEDGDLELELQVALDEDFSDLLELDGASALSLTAKRDSDYCVRARIDGLQPRTVYYYRFLHLKAGTRLSSRVGRTKTAPEPDADVTVNFAVISCQDYSGRYYHAHRRASELDLDFVVHLGDYIYETADDPSFQQASDARVVVFDDVEGALPRESFGSLPGQAEMEEAPGPGLAAQSLDNYRQLYRTYRSDRDLQRLHESAPFIVVWDDHEFSNDSHGATATYQDGRADERNLERRANADQAWFEYMPVDYPAGPDFVFDRDAAFPDNLKIYRDFVFGRHVHLVMTDLRRYRSDHVIPEDALPGAVALDEAQLLSLLGQLPERAEPYVDVEAFADGTLATVLRDAADAGDLDVPSERLVGNLSVEFVTDTLNAIGHELDAETQAALNAVDQRGIPYSQLGKTDTYASFGARYFVDFEVFHWIARVRYQESGGNSEQLLGKEQENWFVDTLTTTDKTWKIWGNEYMLMQRRADLRQFPVPEDLRREFLVSAEDWDGAPNRRTALLSQLHDVENLVVVTGDLHSFFAGSPGVEGSEHITEFVAGAVTSSTYRAILEQAGLMVEGLGDIGVAAGLLLQDANPHMAYQELSSNGFATFRASAQRLEVTMHQIPFEKVREPELDGELVSHFATELFRLQAGTSVLEREVDGEFRVWNPSQRRWLAS